MTAERFDPAEVEAFSRAREAVLGTIAAAASRAGRDPATVSLVAVSKTVPARRVQAAVAGGLRLLGENRVQEGAAKIPEVEGASWQLIGPLQSNKARRAVELFDVIESVHATGLAARLDAIVASSQGRAPLPVLLQVNVDGDPAKAGFTLPELEAAVEVLDALRAAGEALRSRWPRLGPELSMGMSDDYGTAVEEGATIVRVGRAIFGER